jgi:hypothetical protein
MCSLILSWTGERSVKYRIRNLWTHSRISWIWDQPSIYLQKTNQKAFRLLYEKGRFRFWLGRGGLPNSNFCDFRTRELVYVPALYAFIRSCNAVILFLSFTIDDVATVKLNINFLCVRCEIFTAVKMLIVVFWIMTPCCLVGRYRRFGGTCRLTSTLQMEAIRFFETLVITYKTTGRHNPEDNSPHSFTYFNL